MHTIRLATCTGNFMNWLHTLIYRVTQNLLDTTFLLLNVDYQVNCAPSGIAPSTFGKSRFGDPSKRTYIFRLLYLWLHKKKSTEEYFKLYSASCPNRKSWKHLSWFRIHCVNWLLIIIMSFDITMKYRQCEKKSYNFKTIHLRCVVDSKNHRQTQSNTTIRLLSSNSTICFGPTGGNNWRLDKQLLFNLPFLPSWWWPQRADKCCWVDAEEINCCVRLNLLRFFKIRKLTLLKFMLQKLFVMLSGPGPLSVK